MKVIFVGLVLVAGALSANAGEIAHPGRLQNEVLANAPVCPPGQVAKFVGVINGKATWECVPIGS